MFTREARRREAKGEKKGVKIMSDRDATGN